MSSSFVRRLAGPTVVLTIVALSGSLALGTPRRQPCTGLTAKMTHIAGSNGAGHTAYRLTVRNTGRCIFRFDRNHANLILYKGFTRKSKQLPSHVVAEGKQHAFTIAPGKAAHARITFSPDIPGKNEPQRGRCEPVAHSVGVILSVNRSAAQLVNVHGLIKPPTSVCEHGTMEESPLH